MTQISRNQTTPVTLWQVPESSASHQTRLSNGQFKSVSDNALVRDVATLKARTPELVAAFGDVKVGELRELFAGLSVSKIGSLKASERAVFLGLTAGTPAQNAAQQAAILGALTGRQTTQGAPIGQTGQTGKTGQGAKPPRGFDLKAATKALTRGVRKEVDQRIKTFQRQNPGAWQDAWLAEGLKLFIAAGDAAQKIGGQKETTGTKREAFETVRGFEAQLESWAARQPA